MKTEFLHDDGEELWPNKYHLGNGGIYLDGYVNCDIQGIMAYEHPSLVEENKTTIKDYYARLDGDPLHLPTRRATVCDLLSDIGHFGAGSVPGRVDKIVAVQVFEHLTPVSASEALYSWHKSLKYRRPLILSVPDMLGTLEMLEKGSAEEVAFALRHLRGRMGDRYNTHHAWYTQETLTELLIYHGFDNVCALPNFHFYPAIVLRAVKA